MFSRRLFLKAAAVCLAPLRGLTAGKPAGPPDGIDELIPSPAPSGDRPAGTLAVYSDTGTLLSRVDMFFDGLGWHGCDPSCNASGWPARIAWDFPNGERFEGTAGVGDGDMCFNSPICLNGALNIECSLDSDGNRWRMGDAAKRAVIESIARQQGIEG